MAKKYFSGSNSGTGFYNHFEGIVPEWEKLTRYFMIKGGPGVGKSTLMKAVVKQAEEAGEEVECFYCSGDPDSLDGVRLVKRGIVLADATSPHAMDPNYPGAVEEIVSLGDYIIRDKIVLYRDEIEALCKANKQSYGRAYAFLAAAAALAEARYKEVEACVNKKALEEWAEIIEVNHKRNDIVQTDVRTERKERRLFLDAISCKGCISYAESFFDRGMLYRITGEYKDVITDLLCSRIRTEKKEVFCDPLCPHRRNHMWMADGQTGVTCGDGVGGTLIDSEKLLYRTCHKTTARYGEEIIRMKEAAVDCLKECKRIHDDLENIYRDCVEFRKVSEHTEQLLSLIGSGKIA